MTSTDLPASQRCKRHKAADFQRKPIDWSLKPVDVTKQNRQKHPQTFIFISGISTLLLWVLNMAAVSLVDQLSPPEFEYGYNRMSTIM